VDARRSPVRICQAHLSNQIEHFARHGGSAQPMMALPSPVEPKSLSVPTDHGFRLNDHQGRSPAAPQPGELDPQKSIGDTQAWPVISVSALEDQELVPEGNDLGLQRCPSSKELPNRREQREDDREHGIGNL
jgi:hypothetical protein